MRILDAEAVRLALQMADAIEAVRWAYTAVASGQAVMPERLHLAPEGGAGVTLVMPAYVAASPDLSYPAALSVKTVSVFPGNKNLGLASVLGAVLVLDPATGACHGLLDGGALTALRTGAGSGVATDLLARQDAETVAIIGAGGQAAAQLQAVCAVRRIKVAWIYSRTLERAKKLCSELAGCDGVPEDLRAVGTAREALKDADIVSTATGSLTPVFDDCDLKPGVHINAIGAFRPDMAEIPPETVQRARVFVDHFESALHEAGDLVQPLRAGLIDKEHIAGEIGDLLSGNLVGRERDDQVTLFKSVGLAVQDAVCAGLALRNADIRDLGVVTKLA